MSSIAVIPDDVVDLDHATIGHRLALLVADARTPPDDPASELERELEFGA